MPLTITSTGPTGGAWYTFDPSRMSSADRVRALPRLVGHEHQLQARLRAQEQAARQHTVSDRVPAPADRMFGHFRCTADRPGEFCPKTGEVLPPPLVERFSTPALTAPAVEWISGAGTYEVPGVTDAGLGGRGLAAGERGVGGVPQHEAVAEGGGGPAQDVLGGRTLEVTALPSQSAPLPAATPPAATWRPWCAARRRAATRGPRGRPDRLRLPSNG